MNQLDLDCDSYKDDETIIRIAATLFVIRETQKAIILGHKGPFPASRKSGAASSAQARVQNLLRNLGRLHPQGLASRLISAACQICLNAGGIRLPPIRAQYFRKFIHNFSPKRRKERKAKRNSCFQFFFHNSSFITHNFSLISAPPKSGPP